VTSDRKALQTERLRLDPVGPEHAEAMRDAVAASAEELKPWLIWAVDHDLEKSRTFARRCLEMWGIAEWTFSIWYGDELIGCIGLDGYHPLLGSVQLGYWLRTDMWGQGLTTEAGTAVIDFAFRRLNLHRIELHADTRNSASIRVAEKLGFSRVGVLRDGERGIDGWHDAYVFDLLSSDDAKQRTRGRVAP
jgi:RimJ/RimL family protein N-acetyltransferase